MTRKKIFTIGIPAFALLTLAFSPLAFAQTGDRSDRQNTEDRTGQIARLTDEQRSERMAQKRAEIQARLDEMRQKRTEKLDERRLAACERHEAKINSIIQKRSEQASRHLSVFQKISQRVQDFVSDKNLTVDGYDELVTSIETKEADAKAAIEANSANSYDCDAVDGAAPAKLPRESFGAVASALKEYRTAIKDLIVKIKAGQNKTDDGSDTTQNTENETEQPTEGAQ